MFSSPAALCPFIGTALLLSYGDEEQPSHAFILREHENHYFRSTVVSIPALQEHHKSHLSSELGLQNLGVNEARYEQTRTVRAVFLQIDEFVDQTLKLAV